MNPMAPCRKEDFTYDTECIRSPNQKCCPCPLLDSSIAWGRRTAGRLVRRYAILCPHLPVSRHPGRTYRLCLSSLDDPVVVQGLVFLLSTSIPECGQCRRDSDCRRATDPARHQNGYGTSIKDQS